MTANLEAEEWLASLGTPPLETAWETIRNAMEDHPDDEALASGIGGLVHWALFREKDHPVRKAVLLALNDALQDGRATARPRGTDDL